jgi:7,8-dihydropterin-6-yl-methyl-4-(beta-D-ribofuranosyl)aminobenzene 5'-phosphate synthase
MKITIIYDNETSRDDLRADWGFACLVEVFGERLLFDTGANGDILLGNMKTLGIDPGSIDRVVISHAHWDHTGGLADFLKKNKDVALYVPSSYHVPSDAAREVIVVTEPLEIREGIFSTGELQGIEQSLVVMAEKGPVVIAGCSHPGVGEILKAASAHGTVYALIGGLHGSTEFELMEKLGLVCATHCTEFKGEIASRCPDTYLEGGAGVVIDL